MTTKKSGQDTLEFEGAVLTGSVVAFGGEVSTKPKHLNDEIWVLARTSISQISFPLKDGQVSRLHKAKSERSAVVDAQAAQDLLDATTEITTGQLMLLSPDGEAYQVARKVAAARIDHAPKHKGAGEVRPLPDGPVDLADADLLTLQELLAEVYLTDLDPDDFDSPLEYWERVEDLVVEHAALAFAVAERCRNEQARAIEAAARAGRDETRRLHSVDESGNVPTPEELDGLDEDGAA